jgi:hypothetical protein
MMRLRNVTNLPEYLVISANSKLNEANGYHHHERGLGKRTSIPVAANIISRQNTFEHLSIKTSDLNHSGTSPYDRVM